MKLFTSLVTASPILAILIFVAVFVIILQIIGLFSLQDLGSVNRETNKSIRVLAKTIQKQIENQHEETGSFTKITKTELDRAYKNAHKKKK